PQAIYHLEGPPLAKGVEVGRHATLVVLRVNALGPAHALLLLHRPAGEVEPRLVEEIAQGVEPGHPQQHRGGIRHGAKHVLGGLRRAQDQRLGTHRLAHGLKLGWDAGEASLSRSASGPGALSSRARALTGPRPIASSASAIRWNAGRARASHRAVTRSSAAA